MRALYPPFIRLTGTIAYMLLGCLFSTPGASAAPPTAHRELPEFLLGGIQIREPDQSVWISALDREGMNAVSVTTYAEQGAWDTDAISFDPNDHEAISQIRSARKAGMTVVFIPRVRLAVSEPRNRFAWHGMIMPLGDEQLTSWFKRYSDFILTWAKVCESEGVEVFALGSELTELTSTTPLKEYSPLHTFYLESPLIKNPHVDDSQSAHRTWAAAVTFEGSGDTATRVKLINRQRKKLEGLWRTLVTDLRTVFTGRITYAANFDGYKNVSFWNDLDLVGINAYFELRESETVAAKGKELSTKLVAGWSAALNSIEVYLKEFSIERPVLFTEVGYTRRRGSTVYPWDHEGIRQRLEPIFDDTERVLAVQALAVALKRNTVHFLRGLLYWRLSTMEREREYEPYLAVLGSREDKELFNALRAVAAIAGSSEPPPSKDRTQ